MVSVASEERIVLVVIIELVATGGIPAAAPCAVDDVVAVVLRPVGRFRIAMIRVVQSHPLHAVMGATVPGVAVVRSLRHAAFFAPTRSAVVLEASSAAENAAAGAGGVVETDAVLREATTPQTGIGTIRVVRIALVAHLLGRRTEGEHQQCRGGENEQRSPIPF